MPNSIGIAGLEIQTFPEIVDEIINGKDVFLGLKAIYGDDINLNPNSPDAEMVNIYALGKQDVLDLIQNVYASFSPDMAVGRQLDRVCAYNGVNRRAGTYTQQVVTVTTDRALTLPGLDATPVPAFMVVDGSGNNFELVDSFDFTGAGANDLLFRAELIGEIITSPNTIKVIQTPTLGVTGVNNLASASVVGTNEETDAALRIRRANSVALPSKGWFNGLWAGILAVDGVTDAKIVQNNSSGAITYDSVVDMPPHSIWIIVAGAPNAAELAAVIYAKLPVCDFANAGIGAVATVSLDGTTVYGLDSLVDPGKGYDNFHNGPIYLSGGGGTGATAYYHAVPGSVSTIVAGSSGSEETPPTSGGSGYTSPPAVVINPNTVATAITQADGSQFWIYWDTPKPEELYFRATLTAITGVLDKTYIATAIYNQFKSSYGIAQSADTAAIVQFIKSIAPNVSVASEELSIDNFNTGGALIAPTDINYQLYFPSASNITIS